MSTIHTLLPSNSQIESSLETLRRATDPLLGTITHFKEQFLAIDKQRQDLFAISQRVLASLDEEIKKEMKRIDLKPISAAKKETVKKEEKKCADLQFLQSETKATSKVSVRIPMTKNLARDIKQILANGAYICFLCLKENNKEGVKNSYMWQLDSFYLNHLQDRHNIRPDFEVLRLGAFKSIPFSHAFLNNSLVNLLKGHSLQRLIQSHCLWEFDYKDKICICSCAAKQDTSFDKLAIFSTDSDRYIDHVNNEHAGNGQSGSSHKIIKKENMIYVSKIGPTGKNSVYNDPKIIADFQRLPTIIDSMTDFAVESLLVEAEPEIRLELISKMKVSWPDVFLPLPGCHKSTPTLKDMKAYLEKHWNSIPKVVRIADLSEQESRLINLQVSLLKPSVFICGECLNIVSHDRNNYIAHITQKHEHINALNSHVFAFLKQ